MFSDFKSEIKLFLIAAASVVIAVGGIWLLNAIQPASPTGGSAPAAQIPSVTITSPQGGEQWPLGSKHSITWEAANVQTVRISYAVGGKAWEGPEVDASIGRYDNLGVPDVSGFGKEPPYEVSIRVSALGHSNVFDQVIVTVIEAPIDISTWQTYRNAEFGFEFRYPKVLADHEDCKPRESQTVDGWVYVGSRIGINIADFPRDQNLAEFVDNRFSFTEFNEFVKNPIVIGGEEGLRVSFETKNRGRYGETSYVLQNGKIFIFVFTTGEVECPAAIDNSISELSAFNQILATFRFVEPLFVRQETWGPCPPEDEPCNQLIKLYNSGKLVATGNANYEKKLTENEMQEVRTYLRESNLMTEDCSDPGTLDYSASYTIHFEGQTQEVTFPACREEMKALERLIGISGNHGGA